MSPPRSTSARTDAPTPGALNWRYRLFAAFLSARVLAALTLVALEAMRTNPHAAPGFEGYVYERPRLFGHGGFKGTVTGPGNFGASLLRNEMISIDVRPATYSESFHVLARDDMDIGLRAHAVIRLVPGRVVDVVDGLGGPDWYARFVREILRGQVRDAARRYTTTEFKTSMEPIAAESLRALQHYLAGTPVRVLSLVVGEIAYPKALERAVEQRVAARQELQERSTRLAIERAEASVRVVEANGQAEVQRVLGPSLSGRYLQLVAVEAMAARAELPGRSILYVPTGRHL